MAQDSDEHLTRYLLGELPDSEAERLDEHSVTDDALAARLRALEDDLVDRFARGQSTGVSRARFEQAQRASPYLQTKVQFAEALHAWTAKNQAGRPDLSTDATSAWRWWMPAAAAILLIVTAGYLVRANQRLRNELAHVAMLRVAVENEKDQLQRELDARPVQGATPSAAVVSTFVLRPPRRGLERDAATIALRKETTEVALRLEVEADVYPRFWAALRDSATGAIVWRSPDVAAEAAGANRIATIVVPAKILRPQRYAIELAGVGRTGESELVGVYAMRVTVE